ncbi:MAG: hypothetical protein ETSY1_34785 [Candidatus Entotheonella factor]|uniref:Uncharacterized protein n=1 Tax=Entotheonella factor TaxID=1429438 RepID=W4LAW3_ENTF1|nr:MAG: hypothetical protein ETSY1_34785 [Candidatus Entotheonella factor]
MFFFIYKDNTFGPRTLFVREGQDTWGEVPEGKQNALKVWSEQVEVSAYLDDDSPTIQKASQGEIYCVMKGENGDMDHLRLKSEGVHSA